MKRPAPIVIGIALLGLAVVTSSQPNFAQSDPLLGTWQLNLDKSKYSPGPPPKSQTVTIQADGQNHKLTLAGVDAAGKPANSVIMRVYDGMSHPVAGNPGYDAESATRAGANTVLLTRTKAGKLVEVDTMVVSSDGKTRTFTSTGIDGTGRPLNNIAVFDRQ